MDIQDQPPPLKTDRTPAWDLVVSYCRAAWPKDEPIVETIIQDMLDRDKTGRERYGEPLTSHNGRKHLVDAYQEALDAGVYLMAWLDENGGTWDPTKPQGKDVLPHVLQVQLMFVQYTSMLPMLREMINEGL